MDSIEELKDIIQESIEVTEDIKRSVNSLDKKEGSYNNFLKMISSETNSKKSETDGFTTWDPENYEDITTDENGKDPSNDELVVNN